MDSRQKESSRYIVSTAFKGYFIVLRFGYEILLSSSENVVA